MAVIQHGAVYDAFRIFGKMLQVLIVRRNYTETAVPVETIQQSLGNGTTYLGFRTATELIDQYDCLFITVSDEILHVGQMGTISTQVVLNTLLVTDINKNTGEYTGA